MKCFLSRKKLAFLTGFLLFAPTLFSNIVLIPILPFLSHGVGNNDSQLLRQLLGAFSFAAYSLVFLYTRKLFFDIPFFLLLSNLLFFVAISFCFGGSFFDATQTYSNLISLLKLIIWLFIFSQIRYFFGFNLLAKSFFWTCLSSFVVGLILYIFSSCSLFLCPRFFLFSTTVPRFAASAMEPVSLASATSVCFVAFFFRNHSLKALNIRFFNFASSILVIFVVSTISTIFASLLIAYSSSWFISSLSQLRLNRYFLIFLSVLFASFLITGFRVYESVDARISGTNILSYFLNQPFSLIFTPLSLAFYILLVATLLILILSNFLVYRSSLSSFQYSLEVIPMLCFLSVTPLFSEGLFDPILWIPLYTLFDIISAHKSSAFFSFPSTLFIRASSS